MYLERNDSFEGGEQNRFSKAELILHYTHTWISWENHGKRKKYL